LKLAAERGDLDAVTRALEARFPDSAIVGQRLVSTYFDTPDCALQQSGAVLRVREQDGRFVQTVKTEGPAGSSPLARGEWEDKIAENRPDLQAPESGSRIPAEIAGELRPVFVSEVDRAAIEIAPEPGTRIEAAIDQGMLRSADNARSQAISEIELELKEGDRASVYDLALQLLEAAPLRIDLRSKAERGYRLIEKDGEAPTTVSAEPVVLAPEMTVEETLQRVGGTCLTHLLRSEPAALAGKIEGIHQMRVAMRRLRSMLSAVRDLMPEAERRWASDEVKGLINALGPARNLDVFATELLPSARAEAPDQPGWDELAAAAERVRAKAHHRVADQIRSPEHTASLLRLLRWFESRGWRSAQSNEPCERMAATIGEVAPAVLDRRHKKLRKRSRHFRRLSAHDRHRLRIAVKKLRYAIELLESLYDERDARPFVKRLKRVQDELGYANDVRVAYGLVIELGRSTTDSAPVADAGAQLLAGHQRALVAHEEKLRRYLRQLNQTQPFWRA
jgi:inorganic triphosphatase YgiF